MILDFVKLFSRNHNTENRWLHVCGWSEAHPLGFPSCLSSRAGEVTQEHSLEGNVIGREVD